MMRWVLASAARAKDEVTMVSKIDRLLHRPNRSLDHQRERNSDMNWRI